LLRDCRQRRGVRQLGWSDYYHCEAPNLLPNVRVERAARSPAGVMDRSNA
jgi:hypothetical protein